MLRPFPTRLRILARALQGAAPASRQGVRDDQARLPWRPRAWALVVALSLLAAVAVPAARTSQAGGTAAAVPPLYAVSHDHGGHHLGHGLDSALPSARPADQGVSPLFGNLGGYTHPITVRVPLAQQYFDEGLNLTYGFNHAEAIRAFGDAATLDPACAMCYWGIANALGPNINAEMNPAAAPEAWTALQKALELAPGVSAAEQAYIQALSARYAAPPASADRSALDRAYANRMRELVRQYPDDLEAATLFAEALMDLTPWDYWTRDGKPTGDTEELVATLESVLARNPNHPGANHFYIHAVEASQTPGRAVPSADRLKTLVPGAGHLVHMPAHTYWRVGRYQDAVQANLNAIRADESYLLVGGATDKATHGQYGLGYYPHNIHFVFSGAQMSGQSALAIEYARKLVNVVNDDVIRARKGLEGFRPMPMYALVRFGRWDAIMGEPAPPEEFAYARGMWHWGRGMALLRLGQFDRAEGQLSRLTALAASDAIQVGSRDGYPLAPVMLDLAANILGGELAGARGRTDEMISKLERAVAIQDGLSYTEPPHWYYPARHNLGVALLALGRASQAEAVYRADLHEYPDNGWALFGLMQSLRLQGRLVEAAQVEQRFLTAWRDADTPIPASRF